MLWFNSYFASDFVATSDTKYSLRVFLRYDIEQHLIFYHSTTTNLTDEVIGANISVLGVSSVVDDCFPTIFVFHSITAGAKN